MFSLSINGSFFFILIASVHNFADDNTLSAFAENVSKSINILQNESEVITDWFKKNQMIVNADKFQVIIIDRKKGDHTNENVVIDNKQIKILPSVELLVIQLDDKLNFSPHISNICKSAANQLNALIRLQKFTKLQSYKEIFFLINSYFMANFNYSLLIWMFSSAVSLKKIENLQKRTLRSLYKTYNTSYEDILLRSGFSSMNVKRLRTLCIEIFKTLNNLNPSFMKEIFSLRETNRPVQEKYKLNLDIPSYNQVTFGRKALTFFGRKIWNSLPYHIKSAKNCASFKTMIKFWNGETCSCKICCKN